jgi:hypothetical protein
MSTANKKQIGGEHYKKAIDVWDFVHRNGIGYLEGNIIKYVSRYKDKNGAEDLAKAMHYLEKLIEEYEQGAAEEDIKQSRIWEMKND